MSSMLFSNPEVQSLLANRHRRTPCVLLVDTSGSMEGEKIRRLNAGFRAFRDDILRNPMAAQSVELCVISFGPVPGRPPARSRCRRPSGDGCRSRHHAGGLLQIQDDGSGQLEALRRVLQEGSHA